MESASEIENVFIYTVSLYSYYIFTKYKYHFTDQQIESQRN